jgi:hypothetical protein
LRNLFGFTDSGASRELDRLCGGSKFGLAESVSGFQDVRHQPGLDVAENQRSRLHIIARGLDLLDPKSLARYARKIA